METLSARQRFFYGFIGRFYQFAHRHDGEDALGPTWAGVVRLATLILVGISWWRGWGVVGYLLTIGLAIGVRLAFWLAKRRDYAQFISSKTAVSPTPSPNIPPLAPNEKLTLIATGRFSSNKVETLALLRPATYWQLPVGDHTLMVEMENGRFHYQFFTPQHLISATAGWLIHGSVPQPALAVIFHTDWGPEFADTTRAFYARNPQKSDGTTRQRTIYLHFPHQQDQIRFQNSLLQQLTA